MMKAQAVLATLLFVALAGCGTPSGKSAETTTCPDGTVVTLEDDDHHGNKTATTAGHGHTHAEPCAGHGGKQQVPPSVRLGAATYRVQVYGSLPISWSVSNGTHPGGHTMLTSVRLSHHSVAAADLKGPDSYGVELVKVEHQNVPASFNLTTAAGAFPANMAGTRYLRAYAQIQADDLPLRDYWSEEVAINVSAVQPTGVVHTILHGRGGPQGGLTPATVSAKLGDAVQFQNEDVLAHTFTNTAYPSCAAKANDVSLAAGVPTSTVGPTPPILLTCPGPYTFKTDDLPEGLTVTLNAVAA